MHSPDDILLYLRATDKVFAAMEQPIGETDMLLDCVNDEQRLYPGVHSREGHRVARLCWWMPGVIGVDVADSSCPELVVPILENVTLTTPLFETVVTEDGAWLGNPWNGDQSVDAPPDTITFLNDTLRGARIVGAGLPGEIYPLLPPVADEIYYLDD